MSQNFFKILFYIPDFYSRKFVFIKKIHIKIIHVLKSPSFGVPSRTSDIFQKTRIIPVKAAQMDTPDQSKKFNDPSLITVTVNLLKSFKLNDFK